MATVQTQPLAEAAPAGDPAQTAQAIRAEINRRNSLLSTGPSSPEGKEAVRLNALKTGLYAKTILLPHEDRAGYEAIGVDIAQGYDPQTPTEKRLAQAIQDTAWRIQRVISIETNLHLIVAMEQAPAIQTQFGIDDPIESFSLGQVSGYLAHARAFDQLNKHEARLRKLNDKQIRELCTIIVNRPPPEPQPAPQPAPAQATGFVSSKPETPAAPTAKPGVLDGVPQHILDGMPTFVGKTAEMHQAQWLKKHWTRR
jgi:hypothetical protein